MDAMIFLILWASAMPFLMLCSVLAALLIFALILLIRRPGRVSSLQAFDDKAPMENLSALHCRHFPQLRQVLSRRDEDFLRSRTAAPDQRRWRTERRRVAREFLKGLGEDFVRLDRLARTVAALSPELNRSQEAERVWLGLRFRMTYSLVQAQLAFGSPAPKDVVRLAEMIGTYAAKIEATMVALEQHSPARMGANFSV